MKTLALFYNEENNLKVTDSINNLYRIHPNKVVMFENALQINRYLSYVDKEVCNSDFLQTEIKRLRKDIKLYKDIDEALKEGDVMELRRYIEDELLK